jgi:hypothetical protein
MSQKDDFARYPQEVRSSTQQPSVVYTRLPGHYAAHGQRADAPPPGEVVATLIEGEDKIEVLRGEASERKGPAAPGKSLPVYALQPGGTPAVPTGQVFIRFKENVAVEARRREIERAGYEIAQSLEYAPHAAWLRARSGEIADALINIPNLEKIDDVENVEPQMLMQRASR